MLPGLLSESADLLGGESVSEDSVKITHYTCI